MSYVILSERRSLRNGINVTGKTHGKLVHFIKLASGKKEKEKREEKKVCR